MQRVLLTLILLTLASSCATGDIDDGLPSDGNNNETINSSCTGPSCKADDNCVDNDGDGYGVGCAAGPDCDDSDFQRSSGFQETCDGKDNDCNNIIDDNPDCDVVACIDNDGDSQGMSCAAGPDCDDTDAERFDGAPEACDGKDNDCDDQTDEDFALGEACAAGMGECAADGVTVCSADGTGTTCDATPGTPGTEVCDRLDNDCDGQTDEGLNCPACIDDANEPDNRSPDGTPLSSGSVSGQLCPSGEADWFRLGSYSAGQTVSVTAEFSDAQGDIDMEMFVGGQYATGAYSGTDNESISYTLQSSGTVDVRLYFPGNASPAASGVSYTISR